MPGPVIARLLEPADYTAFYHLVYWYSDELLNRIHTLKLSGEVTSMFARAIPDDESSERVTYLHQAATALDQGAGQLGAIVYRYFWPVATSETGDSPDDFHAVYQERWHPYDSPVWDALFTECEALIDPRLNDIAGYVQQLRLLTSGKMPEARRDTTRQDYQRVNQIAVETAHRLDDLRELLDPQALDVLALKAWVGDSDAPA